MQNDRREQLKVQIDELLDENSYHIILFEKICASLKNFSIVKFESTFDWYQEGPREDPLTKGRIYVIGEDMHTYFSKKKEKGKQNE